MTPLERVRRTRDALAAAILVSTALWGVAAALVAHGTATFVVGSGSADLAAVVAGVAVAGLRLWRTRAIWSLERTALWVEERTPALQYALVTAIDPRASGETVGPELARVVGGAGSDITRLVRRACMRRIAWALAAAAATVAVSQEVRVHIAWHVSAPTRPPSHGAAALPIDRLASLTVRVTPPAYARQPTRTLDDPSVVSALVGSTVVIGGRGSAAGVRGRAGSDTLPVNAEGGRWAATVVMPVRPTAVTLADGIHARVLALDPRPDAPPTVTLERPTRDSTLRTAAGTLMLDAVATDDIGLDDGYFELIISSGEEEGQFVSAERRIGRVVLGDVRRAPMHAAVDLAALGLLPGGLLSVRAVARDGNTIGGPGVGASETRTIRIARPQEYDSIDVQGAPPPAVDSSYLSQRMIVLRTEALVRQGRHLRRDTVALRAAALGEAERQLRDRVAVLLNGSPDDADEVPSASPSTAEPGAGGPGAEQLTPNQRALFDSAYRALGDASRDLDLGAPNMALAPERIALRTLDSARVAKRYLIRGRPPMIVVNTDRVRLTGSERANATPRLPGPARDTVLAVLLARLGRATQLAARAPAAAADSVTALGPDVADAWPAAGAALGEAADALRAGRDAGAALARAQRALVGPARPDDGPAAWNGGAGGAR